MKNFFTLVCVMSLTMVALPCLLFGSLGLVGGLADVSPQENRRFALTLLNIAGAIMGVSTAWFFWLYHTRRKAQ
jgi:hypothetical protein